MATLVLVPALIGGASVLALMGVMGDFYSAIQPSPASATFTNISKYLKLNYEQRSNNEQWARAVKHAERQIDQISKSKSIEKIVAKFIDGTLNAKQKEKMQAILFELFFDLFEGKISFT